MWEMKEWFLEFFVHSVWRRRKRMYYALSVISIVGNLIVLVGPSLQASIVLQYGELQAAWSALPQVAELVLHRSVLYILLNLIVVRIMVKSGVLGRASGTHINQDEFCPASSCYVLWTPGWPIKQDELHLVSSYHVVCGTPWPASNTYTVCGTQSAAGVHVSAGPSMLLQQAQDDSKSSVSTNMGATLTDVCRRPQARQHPIRNNIPCDDEQPKCVPAPSLFTIEPLTDLLQDTDQQTQIDDQLDAQNQKVLDHPLRKVTSRADLLRSGNARVRPRNTIKAELLQENNEQCGTWVVAAKHGAADTRAGADDDNELSRQEFNERVDTFISKFKRNLTMQRQDSLNRLLGLVGIK